MVSVAPASSISSSQIVSMVDVSVGIVGTVLARVWVDVLVKRGLEGWHVELYTFTTGGLIEEFSEIEFSFVMIMSMTALR